MTLALELAVDEGWTVALYVLIPIVTGLITKLDSSNSVKAVTAMVLTSALALLEHIATLDKGESFDVNVLLVTAAIGFAVQLASYLGIWKPIGATERVPLQAKTANFGIG